MCGFACAAQQKRHFRPGNGTSSGVDVRPAGVKHVEVRHVDVRSVDVRPADVRPVDVRPVDVRPLDVRCGVWERSYCV